MKTGQKQSPETVDRMRLVAREWWANSENRAKRTGHKLTGEHREKLSQAKLRKPTNYWLGKKRGTMSAEWRAKISAANAGRSKPEGFGIGKHGKGVPRSAEVVAKMRLGLSRPEAREKMRQSVLGKPCRHSKHPAYYKGRRFRSTYEVRVAKALDVLGIAWEYESRRFDCGAFTYCPDFYLPADDVWYEVKGWYGPDSQRKVMAFRAKYPDISLVVFPLSCIVLLENAARKAAA